MTIRKVRRGRKVVLVVDIVDERIKGGRYRRTASVQEMAAAKLEEKALREHIARQGHLDPDAPGEEAAPVADGMTLAQFWTEVFEPGPLALRRPATRISYGSVWSRPVTGLRDLLGGVPLRRIDGVAATRMAVAVRREGRTPRPQVILLRSMLSAAVELGALEVVPRLPRNLYAEPRKLPKAPSREEVALLIAEASGWLRAALVLSCYAGLRMGEVRALRAGDVDLGRGLVAVRRAYSEDELQFSTKTGAERVVPLSAEAVALLRPLLAGVGPERLIVRGTDGGPIRRQHVLHAYVKLRRRLGLPSGAYHATRHFFASALLRTGTDVETARSLTGHASVKVFERYVHSEADGRREAVERLTQGHGTFTALTPQNRPETPAN
jgi:integrase